MHWRGWPDQASRGRAVGDLENDARSPDVRAKRVPFNAIVAAYLKAVGDPREVVRDREVRYWGGRVEEHSLVPLAEARLNHIGLDEWLRSSQARA
jgi:hypothetical protein